uniref:3-dehydroquinate synthase n=1 Tax=Candidatus Kentrum sp. MB TaxID=2138164 RepID=A0A450XK96_9GAMM|nr:MAG: 3-dehydroquinate synthase [Candidatus Kentron sp. MB]VFK29649.1 MAG: 3-dehydroquinate synthase [Candidatus Kentron sp. MB]VFK74854.1 MAG: 3-dehydroquinate synthase [Candidatus Kentron sp. MB]
MIPIAQPLVSSCLHAGRISKEKTSESLSAYHRTPEVLELDTALKDSSPYFLGYTIASAFPSILCRHDFDRVFLISDLAVSQLYGPELIELLHNSHVPVEEISIANGERGKTFATLSRLCEDLVRHRISKNSILIAFGGGVIGNIVGLAAGLIYRGVRFIDMPTTLMGQTDSALSNKQAINGDQGKNQFGIYYPPLFVWSDVRMLRSELPRYVRSGLVEGVKNALISDIDFLDYLQVCINPDLSYSDAEYFDLVYRLIESKRRILEKDPTEKHYAIVLEYGHTFGHAIELLAQGHLSHGECVAVGMCLAAELAHNLHLIDDELRDRHYRVLGDVLGIDLRLPIGADSNTLLCIIDSDNKRTGRSVRHVLLSGPGRVAQGDGDYMISVPTERVRIVLDAYPRGHASSKSGG